MKAVLRKEFPQGVDLVYGEFVNGHKYMIMCINRKLGLILMIVLKFA